MHRCAAPAAALVAAAMACSAAPAFAQTRTFPASALRGEFVITQPPEIVLNGQASRLAPGARIHDPQNALRLTGWLAGQRFVANYTRDLAGQPLEIWILTAAEAARRPWPTTPEQAQAWRFDAAAQTWTKP